MQITPTASNLPSLERTIYGDGPDSAKILILTDVPEWADQAAGRPLTGAAGNLLFSRLRDFGIRRTQCRVESIYQCIPPGRKIYSVPKYQRLHWEQDCLERLKGFKPNIILGLGSNVLKLLTGQSSIDKWQLSVLATVYGKFLPCLHPERILRVFKEIPFLTLACERLAEESLTSSLNKPERDYKVSPSIPESLSVLKKLEQSEWLSVDIETAAGQITCIGFTDEPHWAISVPTHPRDFSNSADFFKIWRAIARTLGSPSKKVMQNGIYDRTYLSKYGIGVRNFFHDTMRAQKFLHPELPMGLDTIARIYTREPYWKDEGKDWQLSADRNRLYTYNCKDVAVTLEAAWAQRGDLLRRGLMERFSRDMAQNDLISEMSWTGLPINQAIKSQLTEDAESASSSHQDVLERKSTELLGSPINPRSHGQIKALLRSMKFRIPQKQGRESTDKESLLKLRLKSPDNEVINALLQLSHEQKKLSSYLKYKHDPDDRVRYTLRAQATETMRWAGGLDPWGRGFNSQTIPSNLKIQFEAPEGFEFMEIDLRQADARFVAWDSNCKTLIDMYRDGTDIHKWVASRVFEKPQGIITKQERQLGKKTGHGANYDLGPKTFSDSCLLEMNLVMSQTKAARILEQYHKELPEVRQWHGRIREELHSKRKLTTPMGRERIFYDRPGPEMYREAYAYRPQSTVVDIINELALWMYGHPGVTLVNQVHDSVWAIIDQRRKAEIIRHILQEDRWNPELPMRGGSLRIPIEIAAGKNLGRMEEVEL